MSTLLTVYRSAALNAQVLPGTGPKLVVSFAGVGMRQHKCPPPEFEKIAPYGGENTELFISDWSRSWMNTPGLAEQIVYLIHRAERVLRTDHTVAIGNSTGGTMALLMSQQLLRDIPAQYRFDRVSALDAPKTTYFVLHGDAEEELRHARRFPAPKRGRHMIVPGYRHRLGHELRRYGDLSALMFYAMEGRERRVVRRLNALGARAIDAFRGPNEGQIRGAAA